MVYLIGTGPGDEELLTLKAVKVLKKCTAVLYDRLGATNILNYLSEDCKVYYCGKEPGAHYKSQEEINKKIVELHKEGHIVGRIKGGDPFVFGRGGEELLELLKEGINDFQVIPGVTSPISVLNYAGIPITHRKIAQSFHIITGMSEGILNVDFEVLARENGTLVFMMGFRSLHNIVESLLKYGKDKNTLVAVIMEGTLSKQKKVVGNLENIEDRCREAKLQSPCIIVIGDVVQFNNEFNWYERKPLFGKNICITRGKNQSRGLKNQLLDLGAEVTEVNSIKILDEANSLKKYNIPTYNYIILTSVNAVNIFFNYLIEEKIDLRSIKAEFCCIGNATAKAITSKGVFPSIIAKEFISESLVLELKKIIKEDDKILMPMSAKGRDIIFNELTDVGAIVDKVPIYNTVCGKVLDKNILKNVDIVFYTSPSTVHNMINIFGIDKIKEKKAISIGPITTNTLEEYNIDALTCTKHSQEGFLNEVVTLLNKEV